jgi:hypothetical protein
LSSPSPPPLMIFFLMIIDCRYETPAETECSCSTSCYTSSRRTETTRWNWQRFDS